MPSDKKFNYMVLQAQKKCYSFGNKEEGQISRSYLHFQIGKVREDGRVGVKVHGERIHMPRFPDDENCTIVHRCQQTRFTKIVI